MNFQKTKKATDKDHEENAEQKTVSRRAKEIISRHRKRLTFSGRRRSRFLCTLDEIENNAGTLTSDTLLNESPPKKAKRILGLPVSPFKNGKFGGDLKAANDDDDANCSLLPQRFMPRPMAPLATLFDEGEDLNSISEVNAKPVSNDEKSPLAKNIMENFLKEKSSNNTPSHSPLGSIGRSLSAIRSSAGRTFHLRMQSSLASLNAIMHSEPKNNNLLVSKDHLYTPSKTPLSSLKSQVSSSSVTKVANAFLKGFVTGPRSSKPRLRRRSDYKESKRMRCDNNLKCDDDQIMKQKERINKLKSAVHIMEEELDSLATAEEPLYDAIVCDITPGCKPISDISKIILDKVGEEVLDDIDNELILNRKFVLTESGNFKACKYVFFVIDYGTPGNVDKTWQDIRYVFYNVLEKALEHEQITTLLLSYLFTGEPLRDQDKVADSAIASIHLLAQQKRLGNIAKLDIGGVNDEVGCAKIYLAHFKKLVENLSPGKNDSNSINCVNDINFVGHTDYLDSTVFDDSFYSSSNETSYGETSD